MPTREQELMALERKFWTEDAAFYRAHLDDSCLVAFTEMAGVMSRDAVAQTVKEPKRWRDLKLDSKGVVQPTPDTAIVTYEAHATRATGEPYAALVSTGYVKRDGEWKMTFHQQTPRTNGR